MKAIAIIWMDGVHQTFRCEECLIVDGVLFLNQPKYPATDEPDQRIPLNNVRLWSVVK